MSVGIVHRIAAITLGDKGGIIQRNINETYQWETELYLERDGSQYDMKLHIPASKPSTAMGHFVDCILSGEQHMATGEEGLIVMEILDSIYASAAKGEPIKVR